MRRIVRRRTHLPQEASLVGGWPRTTRDGDEGYAAAGASAVAQRVPAPRPELRLPEAEGRVEREAERGLHGHRATPRRSPTLELGGCFQFHGGSHRRGLVNARLLRPSGGRRLPLRSRARPFILPD
jgi:hypothetical protein